MKTPKPTTQPLSPPAKRAMTEVSDHAAAVAEAAWGAADGRKGSGLQTLGDHLTSKSTALTPLDRFLASIIGKPFSPDFGRLGTTMEAMGISAEDSSNILRTLEATIAQVLAKTIARKTNAVSKAQENP